MVAAPPQKLRELRGRGCLRTLRVRLRRIYPPLHFGAFPGIFRSSSDLPRCIVRVVNLTQQRVPLEYKVVWEDQYGAPLLYTAAWQRTPVAETGEKTIVNMAKTPGAARATVTLRFPVDVQIWVPEPDPAQQTTY